MSTEEWREIDGFPDYEVSSLGRVRSFKGKTVRMLKDARNGGKKVQHYRMVSLSNANRKKSVLVHRLVAKAFVNNPNDLPQVNHIDGNPANNYVENLEWCSGADNRKHARAAGLVCNTGKKNPSAILTETDVASIKTLLSNGVRQVRIASAFGVHYSTISCIKRGRSWSHVDASM